MPAIAKSKCRSLLSLRVFIPRLFFHYSQVLLYQSFQEQIHSGSFLFSPLLQYRSGGLIIAKIAILSCGFYLSFKLLRIF